MLVQSSSILELVEIAMSVFDSQEVCAFIELGDMQQTQTQTQAQTLS